MNFHMNKKQLTSSPTSKRCVSCDNDFPSYNSLQQHRKKYHGLKARKFSEPVADLNKIVVIEENSDQLRDELYACKHILTDTEMQNKRHKVFKYRLSKLDPNLVFEKLDQTFEKHDYAAKASFAVGFW